jgi:hypothetical protein
MFLIVSFALCGSSFAQLDSDIYDTYWPEFNSNLFEDHDPVVTFIQIDGEFVTEESNWDALEIAVFVGDECRGHTFMANYVDEGDPYPIIELEANYDNPGEEVTFQMYDHLNEIWYTDCTPNVAGEPVVLHTGEDNTQLYFDYDTAIILSFTSPDTPPITTVTLEKSIEGYGEEDGHYYFIASPFDGLATADVDGLITDADYDLYYFDQNEADEWRWNGDADLVRGTGYLYASKEGTTITFTGTPYSGDGEVTLSVDENNTEFGSWNLVGNPFGEDAYIDKPCYTLENSENYTTNDAGTAIHAMQGLLVVAEGNETLTFNKVSAKKNAKLNMNLRNGNKQLDNAIIVFGEGQQLGKLSFRENSSKIYMPIEGKDYAVVSAESNMGEMPVSFKAEKNGSYTLSFNAEEVSFNYLHLIDNMTGNDVDLLSTPSYSFDARTSDYANRFKLVFATGNASDDTFAFFSNDSFVINNEGNATLQVVDVNGRILSSETINGCANVKVNAAPGVYMIRLVNGDNVKIQKVVVK